MVSHSSQARPPSAANGDGGAAIDRLDFATEKTAAGPDAATLIAWRAKIFHIQGDEARAVTELERSFATAPNELAGEALVLVYGRRAETASVGRICGPLCESIGDANSRMRMIDLCRQNTNATSVEGETAWMSPRLMEWYREETRQRLEASRVPLRRVPGMAGRECVEGAAAVARIGDIATAPDTTPKP